MRVAVIGANGQLGHDIVTRFRMGSEVVVELNHSQIELADRNSVSSVFEELRPDLVINTAAMHHVDRCEEQPDRAFAVNALGARNLALECRIRKAMLVHISTDYVFDGRKGVPYIESDAPLPLNSYGNSKLAGENFIRALLPEHYVVRVSAIFGKAPCRAKGGNNFVTTMLKLGRERPEVRVVDNEIVSPTYTVDIANQVFHLVRSCRFGLYHAAAHGQCSWYQFAKEIFRLARLPAKLAIADPAEFPAKTPRPLYSALSNSALSIAGLDIMKPWESGLREYLMEIGIVSR